MPQTGVTGQLTIVCCLFPGHDLALVGAGNRDEPADKNQSNLGSEHLLPPEGQRSDLPGCVTYDPQSTAHGAQDTGHDADTCVPLLL